MSWEEIFMIKNALIGTTLLAMISSFEFGDILPPVKAGQKATQKVRPSFCIA
jgi:hypothetical protein